MRLAKKDPQELRAPSWDWPAKARHFALFLTKNIFSKRFSRRFWVIVLANVGFFVCFKPGFWRVAINKRIFSFDLLLKAVK